MADISSKILQSLLVLREGREKILESGEGLDFGDRFALFVELPASCYCSIAKHRHNVGLEALLFTSPMELTTERQPMRVPAGSGWLTLPRLDADERLMLIISTHPLLLSGSHHHHRGDPPPPPPTTPPKVIKGENRPDSNEKIIAQFELPIAR